MGKIFYLQNLILYIFQFMINKKRYWKLFTMFSTKTKKPILAKKTSDIQWLKQNVVYN